MLKNNMIFYLQVKGFVIIIGRKREAVYLEPLIPASASEQLEVSAPTQENIPRRVQHLQVSPHFKGTVSG
jgi:hypothetical protein